VLICIPMVFSSVTGWCSSAHPWADTGYCRPVDRDC
jgi:hypothetical protein